MTNPSQMSAVGRPSRTGLPLSGAVPVTDLENFMYMGCAGEVELYKHRITRRYLNIGRNSQRFYRYLNGEYTEISQDGAPTRAQLNPEQKRSTAMSKGVNKAILLGHVGKDPEIRSTNGGTIVASFSLATADRQKDGQGNCRTGRSGTIL